MPATLLLADDSVTVQRVIELTFADEGMCVVAVGDGQQAIERLEEIAPDVVLADVNMPVCDGYEVAAHVKRHPVFGRVPVVLLTGAFDALDETRALEAGYDGVLAKPFEPQAVIALVKRLLAAARGDAADDVVQGAQGARPAPEPAVSPASPDDYFKRLDEVFGRPGSTPAGSPAPAARATSASTGQAPSAGSVQRAVPHADASAKGTAIGHREGAAPAVAPLPALADAFDWLLAEEVGAAGGEAPFLVGTAADSAFIDALARRVAERLGEPAVRDLVGRDLLALAERLVREEIERLKQQA